MNIYFLVEGKTEKKVYSKWIKQLLPQFVEVKHCDLAVNNHFILFNGRGYPNLLFQPLSDSIKDINDRSNYDYLVLCLDVDDETQAIREQYINECLEEKNDKLNPSTQLVVIYQNKCIETWFLGNREFVDPTPSIPQLSEYIQHFIVRDDDPEEMSKPGDFVGSIARFHGEYFKLICKERNSNYSKTHTGVVTEKTSLDELKARFNDTEPHHIASFGRFLRFCETINQTT